MHDLDVVSFYPLKMLIRYLLTVALALTQHALGAGHQNNAARLHQWISSLFAYGLSANPLSLLPHRFTVTNHRRLLSHKEEWMVFINGGNRTCGSCQPAEAAWNAALPLLASSLRPPGVATLDCDREAFLCTIWPVAPPQILHLLSNQEPSRSLENFEARLISMQHTTPLSIARIHTRNRYMLTTPYKGIWHPTSGPLSRLAPKLGLSGRIIKFMMA